MSNEKCLAVFSDDSEEWMHSADSIIDLIAVLQQQGDITAEFFLLCLEVYWRISTLIAGFYMAVITGAGILLVTVTTNC